MEAVEVVEVVEAAVEVQWVVEAAVELVGMRAGKEMS